MLSLLFAFQVIASLRWGVFVPKRDYELLNLAPLLLGILFYFLSQLIVKLKLFLSPRSITGSQVSLCQSIVRLSESLLELRPSSFGTDLDCSLILGNRLRKICALRIENPQLQIRGSQLRIEMHRFLQQRLHVC